jgi:hypothetical protein
VNCSGASVADVSKDHKMTYYSKKNVTMMSSSSITKKKYYEYKEGKA